jgi:tetratricopeptide (TPR) repeat protein
VGWFALWRRNSNLKSAINAAARNPSPAAIANVIGRLINAGKFDDAMMVARQAIGAYPKSESIKGALRDIKKVKYAEEMKSINDQLKKSPNPTLYARLAEVYYDLGEKDQTLELCRLCISNFPEYESAYAIMGRLRHERFRADGLVRDGMIAVESFEKAIRLNPSNYKTLMDLSEIYLEIGAIALAIDKLEKIIEFDRSDERANRLIKWARAQAPLPVEDLEELFKVQQERRMQLRLESAAQRTGLSKTDIEAKIGNLENIPGIISIALVTSTGAPITYRMLGEGLAEDAFLSMVSGIISAAQSCSQRMDIGSVERGTMMGEYVRVHYVAFETLSLIVLTDVQSTKPEEVDQRIDEFIDTQLYARGGVA